LDIGKNNKSMHQKIIRQEGLFFAISPFITNKVMANS